MKTYYEKPEFELITFVAEAIMDDTLDGNMSGVDNPFGDE